MRHSKSGRKLGRTPSHRKALFNNLAKAFITHGRITTTEAKAKTLRGIVEPLITLALKNDVHARQQAYRILGKRSLVNRLFDEIGPAFSGGGGGYTRVVKLPVPRKGDAAPLAIIELVKEPVAAGTIIEAPAQATAPVTKVETKTAPVPAPAPVASETTEADAEKKEEE